MTEAEFADALERVLVQHGFQTYREVQGRVPGTHGGNERLKLDIYAIAPASLWSQPYMRTSPQGWPKTIGFECKSEEGDGAVNFYHQIAAYLTCFDWCTKPAGDGGRIWLSKPDIVLAASRSMILSRHPDMPTLERFLVQIGGGVLRRENTGVGHLGFTTNIAGPYRRFDLLHDTTNFEGVTFKERISRGR